jgi:hypothetical protein
MGMVGIPVSRFEIAEFIGDLFDGGSLPPARLLAAARSRGARPCLLGVLRRLPNRPYRNLGDLWGELPDIPDVYDP